MNSPKALVLIFILICSTGCAKLLSTMYGIKELEGFNKEDYDNFLSSLNLPVQPYSLVSDTAQYNRVIDLGRTPAIGNSLGQPVQIIYFEGNEVLSFHANCFAAGSLSNLNWNTDNRFESFPPKSAIGTDTLGIGLQEYSMIYPDIASFSGKKYTVLVFWTLMMEKISRSAIITVTDNLSRFGKENETAVILINTDKYFSGME